MGLIYGTTSTTNTLDSIPESGALYKAGARNGDVVTKINDKKVKNYDDIQTYLALVKEGDPISINIKNKDGVIYLTHTEVPMELGGKGIGSQLVEKVLLDIEKKDLRLVPLCPFVAGYIQKHPDWKRIVMRGIHV